MSLPKLTIAGAVAGAVALSASWAFAVSPPALHTLDVTMPDGGTAVIRYAGDVAPQVVFHAAPAADTAAGLDPAGWFARDPAFEALERLSAAMDQRMDAMVSGLSGPDGQLKAGGFETGNLPAGSQVTMISSASGNGETCMRSVEITQKAGDKPPHVISRTSGNCEAQNTPAAVAPPAKSSQL